MPQYLLTLPDGFAVEPFPPPPPPPVAFAGCAWAGGTVSWWWAYWTPDFDGYDVLRNGTSLTAPDLLPPLTLSFDGPIDGESGDVFAVRALKGGAVVAECDYAVP